MSDTLDTVVLKKANALLDTPRRWTREAWARDGDGQRCSPLASEARQWCAWGALQKSAFDIIGDKAASRRVADRISQRLVKCPGGLAFVNERGGYDLVRAVMRHGAHPANAEATWPFPDFRTPSGFAALTRRAWIA